ncbi:LysM peptidoglycan-binding domain-containing protein [Coraliomargarita sp. SDUM461004]|uniref:LysM peptidoglycan-binding domain-containing protein n=1 Tax=Thalassobacterium sedimentorum TaxID=3041258 RepID=A0ABU1ALD8_9BACT|nr:LysM peptidoglycan-binding domain-containing protein [Coraliomargarita sp. SDUM461004]MDQ8195605.1 LysM peptidoglycan-binding domain-containing protein [Coraliomargarita sp. SDUM461004]
MKVTKVFGCVLGLHFGVIAVLLVQPGCRTKQPPTQTYTQGATQVGRSETLVGAPERTLAYSQGPTIKTSVAGASRLSEGLIEAKRIESGESASLDAAFNAGFDGDGYAPANSGNEFGEFDDIAPIAPLSTGGQTVQVAGDSFESYTVKKGDNLWTIAKRYNVSLNELYAANGLNKNSVLKIGQQLQIPVEGGTATVNTVSADSYQPSSFNQGSTNYTVKRGDSLSKIASQHGTTVRAIKAANGMTSDLIRVGDTLVLPVAGSGSSSSGSSSSGSAARTPAPTSPVTSANTVSSSGTRTHTVKSGEFPATIARKYGMTAGELLALNGITDPRKLQVGQVLQVSGSGSAANVDSRTETVVSPTAAPVTRQPATPTITPSASASPGNTTTGPVEITVIEADPLVEGEVSEIEADEMFDGAVEIPVIRLEE